MLCCHCKKNQATKTYDRITDGKKQTEYYCLDCYHRLFISIEADAAEGKGGDRQIAMCPYCGTSEEDFRARGLVGCAQCYQSLSKAVIPVVIRLQGTETHCGKKPRNSGEREEMVPPLPFFRAMGFKTSGARPQTLRIKPRTLPLQTR